MYDGRMAQDRIYRISAETDVECRKGRKMYEIYLQFKERYATLKHVVKIDVPLLLLCIMDMATIE